MVHISFEALLWSGDKIKLVPWYVGATTNRAVDLGIIAFRRLLLDQTTLLDFLFTAMTCDLLLLVIIAAGFDFYAHCKMITAIVWASN